VALISHPLGKSSLQSARGNYFDYSMSGQENRRIAITPTHVSSCDPPCLTLLRNQQRRSITVIQFVVLVVLPTLLGQLNL
jgi:hypothetical protein